MEHRATETRKLGKRMRCLDFEMPYSEIVVSTRLANVGISDGLRPGWHQVGAREGAADSRV